MGLQQQQIETNGIFKRHRSSATKKMPSTGQLLLWSIRGRNCRTVTVQMPHGLVFGGWSHHLGDKATTSMQPLVTTESTLDTWVPQPRVTRSAFGECTPVLPKFVRLRGWRPEEKHRSSSPILCHRSGFANILIAAFLLKMHTQT